MVTFTGANGACVPGHGNIRVELHGSAREIFDGCAPPHKIADDVALLCRGLNQSCPTNWDTIAIPFEMLLTVDATTSAREANVP